MAAKKLEIDLGAEDAIRVLDTLNAKAGELENKLQGLASILGSGNATAGDRANFFGGLQELSSVNSARDAARASVAAGGGFNAAALVSAANAGAVAFGAPVRNRSIADPQAILLAAQSVPGMSGAALSDVVGSLANGSIPVAPGGSSAYQVVQQVIQSVQASQTAQPAASAATPALNPFAGAPLNGPATPLGPPGYQANVAYFQQQQELMERQAREAQTYQQRQNLLWAGTAAAGAHLVGQGFDFAANRIINGGSGVGESYQLAASTISTGIGVAAGFLTGNPAIGFGTAAAVESVASPLARYLSAPAEQREKATVLLSPFIGMYSGYANRDSMTDNFVGKPNSRDARAPLEFSAPAFSDGSLQKLTKMLNASLPERDQGTLEDVAASFAGISSGLFAGGRDPFSVVGAYREVYRPFERTGGRSAGDDLNEAEGYLSGRRRGSFRLLDGMLDTALGVAKLRPSVYDNPSETVAERYTRRLGRLVGTKAEPEVAKEMAGIFASEPETGGNVADILTRFGAEKTATYLRIQNDDLSLPAGLDPVKLSRTAADYRTGGRAATLAALQVRGSAGATEDALRDQMGTLASLPDGDKSLAYAETAARARDAGRARFAQEDIAAYGIPMTRLQGERERLQALPFSPGSRYANSLQMINLNQRELGRLRGYRARRQRAGELSEEEELSIVQREESLETGIAFGISDLQNGFENKLPNLSAGRGRQFNQWNSIQGAQLALARIRSPIRDFGAYNGGQKQDQDDWTNGFHVSLTGPQSRTQGINNAGSDPDGRLAAAINRFSDVIERFASGGGGRIGTALRPGEVAGSTSGAIAQRNVGQGRNGRSN